MTSHCITVEHNSRPREDSTQAVRFKFRVEPDGANRLPPVGDGFPQVPSRLLAAVAAHYVHRVAGRSPARIPCGPQLVPRHNHSTGTSAIVQRRLMPSDLQSVFLSSLFGWDKHDPWWKMRFNSKFDGGCVQATNSGQQQQPAGRAARRIQTEPMNAVSGRTS